MSIEEPPEEDMAELVVAAERLREENDRLRVEYTRAKQASHRRAAIGLGVIGILAIGAGLLFPPERDILFAIGAIGLFAAVLTAYLSPERFVPMSVGEAVYQQHERTIESLVDVLGLSDARVYVPVGGTVRLFIPGDRDAAIPTPTELDEVLVSLEDGRTGISVFPTGATLAEDLLDASTVESAGEVRDCLDTTADAIVETLELAERIQPAVHMEEARATVVVEGVHFGRIGSTDHPIVSLIGCALASGLDRSVTVERVARPDEDRVDLEYAWQDS